ncbi:MAG: hypothetical protein AAFY88_02525 [Acidobacteriota bacterium]
MPHRLRPFFESAPDSICPADAFVDSSADAIPAPDELACSSGDVEPPPWTLPWTARVAPCPSTVGRTGFRPDRAEPRRRLISPVRANPELLRRCLSPQRTEEDWRRFKERYECAIRNIAARSLCLLGFGTCRDAVDELVQEVYLRWLRSESGFDGTSAGAFWNFIRVSVRHAMHDRRKFLAADKRRPRAGAVNSVNSQKPPGPHEAYVRHEARRAFLDHCLAAGDVRGAAGAPDSDGVDRSEERYRRALALGWIVLGGCTSREAADFLGTGVGAVDSMLRRLRRRLAAHGVEVPPRRSIKVMEAVWSAAWANG